MNDSNGAGQTHLTSPWKMSRAGWKDLALRTYRETSEDNIALIAAGVSFYGFLALVPLLGAIVLSYGLIADPATVVHNMKGLTSVMPADAAKLIGEQLMNVVKTSGGKKGLGVLFALILALYGARNGAGSVVTALNVAYEEKEKRSFLIINLLALEITVAAVIVAILALISIAALGHLQKFIPGAPDAVLMVGKLLSYLLLGIGGAAAAATLYRYGPSRRNARWVWITPGSALAALCWLLLTLGFGIYVAKFGNYSATYGSLGAVVVLLTWLYLSSYVLLVGAELNSELEKKTSAPALEAGAAREVENEGRPPTIGPQDHQIARDSVGPHEGPHHSAATPVPTIASTIAADLVVARITSSITHRLASIKHVGLFTAGAATIGLALLRKRGHVLPGAVVLSLAGALAWISREPD
jgi:membrane protein